jgi:hypothetical protein
MKFIVLTPQEWTEAGKEARKDKCDSKAHNNVVKVWNLYVQRFQALPYGVEVSGKVMSFAAVVFNKRPKGEWGRYMNSYLAYTPAEYRRQGFATALQRYLENLSGCDRTKSLIKTYAGFRFHLGLGHTFWGRNERGELRCDSPISKLGVPNGVPPGVLDVVDPSDPHPLSKEELTDVMQSVLYKQFPTELERCFKKRSLNYDPQTFQPRTHLC